VTRLSETEVFLAVVAQGGVTAAARHLGLSKSAVSKQLAALEDRLGVRLLHRTTRSLTPTPEGLLLHERAGAALEELLDAERAVSQATTDLHGTLRVSLPLTFGIRYLTPVINQLIVDHPGLTVEASFTDRKVDLVEEGFDAAVRGGVMRPSSLVARKLAPIRALAAASPAFLARHGPVEHPAALEALPALIYRQSATMDTLTWRGPDGQQVEARLRGRLVSDNGDMLLAAAREGLGIVVQPDFLLADDLVAGRLVPVLCGWSVGEAAMWVVHPNRRHVSAKVRLLVEVLVAALRDPPWRAPLERLYAARAGQA
jgi:DNA-binding transcriptional LysR family regulator